MAIAADQSGENQDRFFGRLVGPNEPLCATQPSQQTQVNVIESIASATTAYTDSFSLEGEEALSGVGDASIGTHSEAPSGIR